MLDRSRWPSDRTPPALDRARTYDRTGGRCRAAASRSGPRAPASPAGQGNDGPGGLLAPAGARGCAGRRRRRRPRWPRPPRRRPPRTPAPSPRRPRPARAGCRPPRRPRPGARRRPGPGPRRAPGPAPRPGPTSGAARRPTRPGRLGRRQGDLALGGAARLLDPAGQGGSASVALCRRRGSPVASGRGVRGEPPAVTGHQGASSARAASALVEPPCSSARASATPAHRRAGELGRATSAARGLGPADRRGRSVRDSGRQPRLLDSRVDSSSRLRRRGTASASASSSSSGSRRPASALRSPPSFGQPGRLGLQAGDHALVDRPRSRSTERRRSASTAPRPLALARSPSARDRASARSACSSRLLHLRSARPRRPRSRSRRDQRCPQLAPRPGSDRPGRRCPAASRASTAASSRPAR